VRTLHEQDSPEAVRRILVVLNAAGDWQVRATAADVLTGYEGPLAGDVFEALKRALEDEDEFVATKAAQALESLENRQKGD
jgi:HEAT repeat protein